MSEREIVCEDLNLAIDDLRNQGFRLDLIYPADEPHSASLSDGSETVRLTNRPGAGGPPAGLPPFQPQFLVCRAREEAGEGRAGMRYRDLIPGRLGGRYIASHIRIPDAGPVADWVHFHQIAVQALYVARGWVRVVYEDQGDPFVLEAGDLVLQPPGIRHRVLESSSGLEVIEIAAPALHATFADHDMDLPNGRVDEARDFSGQRFLRHVGSQTPWIRFNGAEAQETGLGEATGGLMRARILRRGEAPSIDFPPHQGELAFGYVVHGSATLDLQERFTLGAGDSFVIPPGERWRLTAMSPDFTLVDVETDRLD